MHSTFRSLLPLVAPILMIALVQPARGQAPNAEQILSSSISFHDPENTWAHGAYRLTLEESRPDGSSRHTVLVIDNAHGRFELESARDGRRIRGDLGADGCVWLLDGSPDFSAEEREQFGLSCDRLEWLRNYYVYLWGMPMKLRDSGSVVEPRVKEAEFQGRSAWEMRVTYDEAVGSDVWYFYFNPTDHALVGYRFYHDETANDGEYITLEGLQEGAGLRLPKQRSWYTHQEGRFLGMDTAVSIEAAVQE